MTETTQTAGGILPSQAIEALIAGGAITLAEPLLANQLQPASLDLRLGAVAYRVRASFLPGPGTRVADKETVEAFLKAMDLDKIEASFSGG